MISKINSYPTLEKLIVKQFEKIKADLEKFDIIYRQ
jgi:hypothetical protein